MNSSWEISIIPSCWIWHVLVKEGNVWRWRHSQDSPFFAVWVLDECIWSRNKRPKSSKFTCTQDQWLSVHMYKRLQCWVIYMFPGLFDHCRYQILKVFCKYIADLSEINLNAEKVYFQRIIGNMCFRMLYGLGTRANILLLSHDSFTTALLLNATKATTGRLFVVGVGKEGLHFLGINY